jgi:endo-1,4-beta-xylanase
VLGVSAGGELAALAAMRGEPARADAPDPIERESSRPAFQVLVYPGRSQNILPTPQSPPAFLLCGADDRPDISEGLASVYLRFKQAGVPAELHVYSGVGHGFGLRASNTGPVAHWLDRVHEWLDGRGLLKK